jgi:predicted small metal-binding protein
MGPLASPPGAARPCASRAGNSGPTILDGPNLRAYTRLDPLTEEVPMAKVLKCADLMPGCDTVIVGKDADEVFAKAEAHARKDHNMTIIPPYVMSQIEAAIKEKT